jgi:DNA-binding response OmpR family regulator
MTSDGLGRILIVDDEQSVREVLSEYFSEQGYGVETLRRLREIAPAVSVIMVTANEDVGLARETFELGALDDVAKPFALRSLATGA